MENFQSLNLPEPLLQSLAHLKFNTPTPIQAQAIPIAMQGGDILGSAQTGTGKTFAFGIPLIARLMENPKSCGLVITPTRELATQVIKSLQSLLGGRTSPIKTALIIGGEPMPKQLRQLSMKPRLFVGTPGRLNDHLTRGTLDLKGVDFLVLDETDRMLDMGFSVQIKEVIQFIQKKRQTLLFSATLPKNIIQLSASYLHEPTRICVGQTFDPVKKIKQDLLHLSDREKYPKLLAELKGREGSVVIFMKTKLGAERMANRLEGDEHNVNAIHGNLTHGKRERVIKAFRNRKHRILVATDVAARGLDIPHIEHVINYDLPQRPEDYIHRIGRTGRAGAEGSAVSFISPTDRGKWDAIHRLMNPNAAPVKRNGSGARPTSHAGKRNFRFSKRPSLRGAGAKVGEKRQSRAPGNQSTKRT